MRGWLGARSLAAAGVLVGIAILPAGPTSTSAAGISANPEALILDPGVGAATWSASFRLESSTSASVAVLPRDLVRVSDDPTASIPVQTAPAFGGACSEDGACIEGASVKLDPSNLDLVAGVPASISVTIAGPLRAGIYRGALDIVGREPASPSPTAAAPISATIALTLISRPAPALTLPTGVSTVVARRIRLDNPLDDIIAGALLSDSERSQSVLVAAVNPSLDELPVHITVAATGQATGQALRPGLVSWTSDLDPAKPCESHDALRLPAGGAAPFRLCLNKTAIPPDRYLGAIYLTSESGGVPQVIPLDLTVKQGPSLPFALLLAGIVVGWILKFLVDRAFPLVGLLDDLRRLNRRILALSEADQRPLLLLAASVRARIDGLDQAGAQTELSRAKTAVGVTEGLVQFELAHPGALADRRDEIRRLLAEGLIDKASQSLDTLRLDAAQPLPAGTEETVMAEAEATLDQRDTIAIGQFARRRRAQALPEFGLVLVVVVVVIAALVSNLLLPLVIVGVAIGFASVLLARWRAIWAFFQHHRVEGAAGLRWLVQFALALVLAVVGLETLYVADAAKLIAAPLDPLVTFAFWGLGSDVASRTILTFAKPS